MRNGKETTPPVYYFDTCGVFRELGKEPVPKPAPKPIPKRKRKSGPRRIVGPCETKNGWLSTGESEYVSD